MLSYPLMHDFVAQTADERARVAGLMNDVVGYIVDHNLFLIDIDGHPTFWGVWNPAQVAGVLFFFISL